MPVVAAFRLPPSHLPSSVRPVLLLALSLLLPPGPFLFSPLLLLLMQPPIVAASLPLLLPFPPLASWQLVLLLLLTLSQLLPPHLFSLLLMPVVAAFRLPPSHLPSSVRPVLLLALSLLLPPGPFLFSPLLLLLMQPPIVAASLPLLLPFPPLASWQLVLLLLPTLSAAVFACADVESNTPTEKYMQKQNGKTWLLLLLLLLLLTPPPVVAAASSWPLLLLLLLLLLAPSAYVHKDIQLE